MPQMVAPRCFFFGSRAARIIGFASLLLLTAALICGFFAIRFALKAGLPPMSGSLTSGNLKNDVKVVRDAYGVPHIYAQSEADAYFALGFVHAQDRLWQMEGARRLVSGQLAEIAGPDALASDKLMRTLGLWQKAAASYNILRPDTQADLSAYAAGVNAWIAQSKKGTALPVEFRLLHIVPAPWTPADSLAIGKLMAWQLSGNYLQELVRLALQAHLPKEKLDLLWPKSFPLNSPSDAAPQKNGANFPPGEVPRLLAALPVSGPGEASDAWVLGGSLTKSHAPILANDPHLQFDAPILWYLAHTVIGNRFLAGATIPGIPFQIAGQNNEIAWGMTTTGADTQDLFIETPAPEKAESFYLSQNGQKRPYALRNEVIHVKDGKDVILPVRETLHGPIITDILPSDDFSAAGGKPLALSFTGLQSDDRTADALLLLSRAHSPDDLHQSLKFWVSPVQNFIFADSHGDIGFMTAGSIPIRKSGDGSLPGDGASGKNDWIGTIPFNDMPEQINPTHGWFANTNNAVIDENYRYFLTTKFDGDLRYSRIAALLQDQQRHPYQHGVAESLAWQMDIIDPGWERLKPILLAAITGDKAGPDARKKLAAWNGATARDRTEPLIFALWLDELADELYGNNLGPLKQDFIQNRAQTIKNLLDSADVWCGDTDPGCGHLIRASWDRTMATLNMESGDASAARWQWGRFHVTTMRNRSWTHIPLISDIADLSIAADGDENTLNRGGYQREDSEAAESLYERFADSHGAGYRAVYDLADPSKSQFVIATGESGQILSPHYKDLQPIWRDGRGIGLVKDSENFDGGQWILHPEKPISTQAISNSDGLSQQAPAANGDSGSHNTATLAVPPTSQNTPPAQPAR